MEIWRLLLLSSKIINPVDAPWLPNTCIKKYKLKYAYVSDCFALVSLADNLIVHMWQPRVTDFILII